MPTPMTKEQYAATVREQFLELMSNWDHDEMTQFIDSPEIIKIINEEFNYKLHRLPKRQKELTEEAYWKSCISSLVDCLALMA